MNRRQFFGVPLSLSALLGRAEKQREESRVINDIREVLHGLFYDSAVFEAGQTIPDRFILFTEPICGFKTITRTNMCLPGILPAPQQMMVRAFRVWTNERWFLRGRVIRLLIANKIYWESPLVGFPDDGFPLSKDDLDEPGSCNPRIGFQQSFWVEVEGPVIKTRKRLEFYAMLEGPLVRSLQ